MSTPWHELDIRISHFYITNVYVRVFGRVYVCDYVCVFVCERGCVFREYVCV